MPVYTLQHELRLKAIAYNFLSGKKPNLHLTERWWVGDELGSTTMNSRAAEFVQVVSSITFNGVYKQDC